MLARGKGPGHGDGHLLLLGRYSKLLARPRTPSGEKKCRTRSTRSAGPAPEVSTVLIIGGGALLARVSRTLPPGAG
ncbi:MAG: hypothetical protein M5U12_20140 [Verrucomicrobia bacterium]|nr:hypothetical protein [Verrucomicrobiota bacterium]